MAVENHSIDEFEPWLTFSPRQQPSTLPGSTSSVLPEESSTNVLSAQPSNASPVDSAYHSPSTERTRHIYPPSPLLDQKQQQQIEKCIANIDYTALPNPSLWFDPILSPSLDPSQMLLNDDLGRECKTEQKASNVGPLSTTQKKRREQNRAAQRNFRQRKEVHLKHLQATIVNAEARRSSLQQDNDYLQRELSRLNIENDRLRRGPSCNRRSCINGRRHHQSSYNFHSKPHMESKNTMLEERKGKKCVERATTMETNESNQYKNIPLLNGEDESSVTATGAGSEPVSEKRPPLRVVNDHESTVDGDSSRSSTNSGSSKAISGSNVKSRTSSISSISSEVSADGVPCESCDKLRMPNESGSDGNENVNNHHEQNYNRVLISAQEALRHIRSHKLFHRGVVDIEHLLCALRRVARYYRGAAVFDRAELERIVEESATQGRNDELI